VELKRERRDGASEENRGAGDVRIVEPEEIEPMKSYLLLQVLKIAKNPVSTIVF